MDPISKRLVQLFKAALLLLLLPFVAQAQNFKTISVQENSADGPYKTFLVVVKGRAEATQPFYLLEVEGPTAQVILFPGGSGNIGVSVKGIARPDNFLVRSRGLFAEQGFNVAVMDVPSDRPTMREFRNDFEHILDIAAVIAHLQNVSSAPIWLVGTSRGTISAAMYASRPRPGQKPVGMVLTSSLVWRRKDRSTVYSARLQDIRIPTLVVHHQQDGCRVTRFEDVPKLMKALLNAKPLKLLTLQGGEEGDPDKPCLAKSHHGFLGQEAEVVNAIGTWMKGVKRESSKQK